MARIRILSDLHLEFSAWRPPAAEADLVVLAGDIAVGAAGLRWAAQAFRGTPVVYVPGNHEYYGAEIGPTLADLRAVARRVGVHVLDRDEVEIAGLRILGATLWTAFDFYGGAPAEIEQSMSFAGRAMLDYRQIRRAPGVPLVPADTRALHGEACAWLAARLTEAPHAPTVVVTHHLPHPRSVHTRFAGDPLNPGFVTDLAHLVREPVRLWVHGHTHVSTDYTVGATRVVCNPRGYLPHDPNPAFAGNLVVTVPAPVPLPSGRAAATERATRGG